MTETIDKSKQSHSLSDNSLGEVKIADEVVAVIAGLATTETEGVASMAGDISGDIIWVYNGFVQLDIKRLIAIYINFSCIWFIMGSLYTYKISSM